MKQNKDINILRRFSSIIPYLFCMGLVVIPLLPALGQQAAISIKVDASKSIGSLKPFWAFFGYDEPNYTTRTNGKKLLSELKELSPVPVYVRTHNLLTSKGNSKGPDLKWGFTDAYKEDAAGNPVYNWTIVDSIIDVFVQRGMKPLMEIGFMPKDLSTKPEPYEHYWSAGGNIWTGWTYPPKDYDKWRELVYQWAKHSIDRYGKKEVSSWLWEVWNEPDIGYWSGTFEEYCKLYDYAADGLKKACPECTIGGPHTTSPRSEKGYNYLVKFIEHCLSGQNYATGKTSTPLQYIGFHAKGAPELVNGHIQMNMGPQLRDVQRAFKAIDSIPALKNIPIVIGECDPEGCAACSETREPRYAYRNGTVYSSYTAASFARIYELVNQYKVNLKGAVSWSFEFENQPWFAGFRDLATNGVDKPVLNIFRMFGKMGGKQIAVEADSSIAAADIIAAGVKNRPDINALASRSSRSVSVMVWNYHDDDVAAAATPVSLYINGLTTNKVIIRHYRVDKNYSNSFEVWKAMGKPQHVSSAQMATLEKAGQLKMIASPETKTVTKKGIMLSFNLPRQAVSLVQISW